MFAGHLPELVIVLVAALVIFGPKRLPEIGGAMGKGIREFKKGTQELEDHVTGSSSSAAKETYVDRDASQTIRDRDAG